MLASYMIIACFVTTYISNVNMYQYFGITSLDKIEPLILKLHDFADNASTSEIQSSELCDMMNLHGIQKKMCKSEKVIAKLLMKSIHTSITECRHQFKDNRWNCPIDDRYRQNLLRKGFRETSFLHALSSASLVHTLAQACSSGKIRKCKCKHKEKQKLGESNLSWKSCTDTRKLSFENQFAKRFLRRDKYFRKDTQTKVNRHNIRVGIRTIEDNKNIMCRCHGSTGSCNIKTCWRQLSSFREIGFYLKRKFEDSHRVLSDGTKLIWPKFPASRKNLAYTEHSPNFCWKSKYSGGISGRKCRMYDSCYIFCCGGKYNLISNENFKPCERQSSWCCNINSTRCTDKNEFYRCK